MKNKIKLLFAALILVFAGCASELNLPATPKVFNSVDMPYTIKEIGDNHILVSIFIANRSTKELAIKANKDQIDSVGLKYRIISRKVDQFSDYYSVRDEVEFLIPKDGLMPVIPTVSDNHILL